MSSRRVYHVVFIWVKRMSSVNASAITCLTSQAGMAECVQ